MGAVRSFQEVSLVVTGAQLFKDRFLENEPHDDNIPRTSAWRCNLTGLSHVHNLYFVAYIDDIYVYEPQFPRQSLPTEPALIIKTEALTPDTGRRITSLHRRAINRLVVQFLGDEEVVAVVRDDGDVEAYYTRHISQAIDKRTHFDTTLGVFASDVRPHFHRNVGHSAWGLAIHSNGRMIAVSSNSFQVTIFAFALAKGKQNDCIDGDKDGEHSSAGEEERCYYSEDEHHPPSDRKQNDVRIIANGQANIPEIAFCNTTNDATGRWLMTADIEGWVRTWDVHTLSRVQMFRSALTPSTSVNIYRHDPQNAAWGVMFLDPLSFRATETMTEAFGMLEGDTSIKKHEAMWNLSETVDQVKGAREPFKNVPRPVEVLDGNYANPLATLHSAPPQATSSNPANASNDDESSEDETEDDYESGDGMEGPESELERQWRERLDQARAPQVRFLGESAICADLPCPILRLSCKDMYLFQPSPSNNPYENLPIAAFGNIFAQELQTTLQPNETSMDRINMHAQIPSLGVVVIGSQKGRVAVISLTRTDTELPDYPTDQKNPKRSVHRLRRLYGCRVDHMLPLATQEAAGHRPRWPLHGIAVGPVQGTEHLEDDQKRWRLMVMYQNHAVLTYEIGRPKRDSFGLELTAM